MNGSMYNVNNYTISPRQSYELIENIEKCALKYKEIIEIKTNEMFAELAKIWADENAVSFAGFVANRMDEAIKGLIAEINTLIECIVNLSNKYFMVSGRQGTKMLYKELTAPSSIDVRIVKNTFRNDDFGFKGGSNARDYYNLISSFSLSTNKIADQLLNEIRNTNAFGNASIIMQLHQAAANISNNIRTKLREISALAKVNTEKAELEYKSIMATIPH